MRRLLSILLVVLSVVLLFWRLDGAYLWRDEATTANWARLMAESGIWLPRVFDGGQLIVQAEDGHDFNSRLLPAMQSWLQFYVAAIGFKLLGISTFSARLPFALLGAVCVWVWYRLGRVLFGSGLRAFLLPYLGLLSIFFLTGARQGRYYVLVILAASLLLLEVSRYLRNPERGAETGFYVRLCLYGFFLYFSNYGSFAGMWLALGVFFLLLGDRLVIRRFVLLSAGMGVVMGVEFWLLHAEFVEVWPPPDGRSTLELYRSALISRGRDFWRTIPLVLLVPAAFYLFHRRKRLSVPLAVASVFAVFVVLSPILLGYDSSDAASVSAGVFWTGAALCLAAPLTVLFCYRRLESTGPWTRAAMLAGLVLAISPILTIAIGKNKTNTRHYYQILPAVLLLGATATAGLERATNRKLAGVFYAGLLVWPNLSFNFYGTLQIAERQWFRDQTYTEPLIHYLRENVKPGDRVAFYRNVKGMTVYFYLPQIRWAALLDSEAPHNRKFRGRLPDDQFDDYPGVDWYVVWDPRGGHPRGLSDQYRKVWEYSYTYRRSWWELDSPPSERRYEVFRRMPAADSGLARPAR